MLPQRLGVNGPWFPNFLCLGFLICLVGTINLPHRVVWRAHRNNACNVLHSTHHTVTQKHHHLIIIFVII